MEKIFINKTHLNIKNIGHIKNIMAENMKNYITVSHNSCPEYKKLYPLKPGNMLNMSHIEYIINILSTPTNSIKLVSTCGSSKKLAVSPYKEYQGCKTPSEKRLRKVLNNIINIINHNSNLNKQVDSIFKNAKTSLYRNMTELIMAKLKKEKESFIVNEPCITRIKSNVYYSLGLGSEKFISSLSKEKIEKLIFSLESKKGKDLDLIFNLNAELIEEFISTISNKLETQRFISNLYNKAVEKCVYNMLNAEIQNYNVPSSTKIPTLYTGTGCKNKHLLLNGGRSELTPAQRRFIDELCKTQKELAWERFIEASKFVGRLTFIGVLGVLFPISLYPILQYFK